MTKRRVPASRQALRQAAMDGARPTESNPLPPLPSPRLQPPLSSCLYSPEECSIYNPAPWTWCRFCQIRAASICAQTGHPNLRHVALAAHAPVACPSSCAPTPCHPTYGMCPSSFCTVPQFQPTYTVPQIGSPLYAACPRPDPSACNITCNPRPDPNACNVTCGK